MALSTYLKNHLLLNRYAPVMNEQSTAFNQVAGRGAPLNRNCSVYVLPDRDSINRALNSSYDKISRLLAYVPRPEWFVDTFTFGKGIPTRFEYFQTKSTENWGKYPVR